MKTSCIRLNVPCSGRDLRVPKLSLNATIFDTGAADCVCLIAARRKERINTPYNEEPGVGSKEGIATGKVCNFIFRKCDYFQKFTINLAPGAENSLIG